MTWEEVKQAAKEIRVIALDMDGTCLNDEHVMTSRTTRVIRELVDRGYLVVPASGRGFAGLREEVIGESRIRYVISNNGAILTDGLTGQRLLERDIPPEVVARMARRLLDVPGNFIYTDDGENGAGSFNVIGCRTPEDYLAIYKQPKWGRELCPPEVFVERLDRAVKLGTRLYKAVLIFDPNRTFEEYDGVFQREFPELSAFHSSGVRQYECVVRGMSKGAALEWLCSHENIAPGRILAMGDNGNDADMLRVAGIGVAMANAIPEIRSMADFVAGSNDADGAAEFLERVFLS